MFRYAALLACLVAVPAMAAAPGPTSTVISAVSGDWNDDGMMDRAVLTDNDDGAADLWVWFGGDNGFTLAAHAPAIANNGGLFGNTPELKLTDRGGLQVSDGNEAIGRDHWTRLLTLAYRGGRLVAAGITANATDTLDPDKGQSCDINLLTGKGVRDGKPVSVSGPPVAVSDWSDDKVPAACQF